jgi:ornithine carbamoyltransferase
MNKLVLFADLLPADGRLLDQIIQRGLATKARPDDYRAVMRGKLLYALYQKTSTRTHLSFARGVMDLGGQYVWQSWESSNFAVGDFEQEVRYVSTTADVVMARLVNHSDVQRMANSISVPLINGCCNAYHPMQGLADCMTMYELIGSWAGIHCVYVGVLNNVVNSLMASLLRLGGKLVVFCPETNRAAVNDELLREAEATGRFVLIGDGTPEQLREEIGKANIVYTDTWVDMEEFGDASKAAAVKMRIERLRSFQLNVDSYGNSAAYILHCMPVHPGYEIDHALLSHRNARFLQQADNRTHAQKGALCYLLEAET